MTSHPREGLATSRSHGLGTMPGPSVSQPRVASATDAGAPVQAGALSMVPDASAAVVAAVREMHVGIVESNNRIAMELADVKSGLASFAQRQDAAGLELATKASKDELEATQQRLAEQTAQLATLEQSVERLQGERPQKRQRLSGPGAQDTAGAGDEAAGENVRAGAAAAPAAPARARPPHLDPGGPLCSFRPLTVGQLGVRKPLCEGTEQELRPLFLDFSAGACKPEHAMSAERAGADGCKAGEYSGARAARIPVFKWIQGGSDRKHTIKWQSFRRYYLSRFDEPDPEGGS